MHRCKKFKFVLLNTVLLLSALLINGCSDDASDKQEDLDTSTESVASYKKVGILFLGVGTDETYTMSWAEQFFANLHDYFPNGFLAGGPIEGGDCFTIIHYANEAEAAACNVSLGTPIDVLCNVYENETEYPIAALEMSEYRANCFDDMVSFFAASDHSTIDPKTGLEITAPVVRDPQGAGIGIADFIEVAGFNWMEYFYYIPNNRQPHREQLLRWWYGNDAPGYESIEAEPLNLKDKLQELYPDTAFAFRHGWEAYMENKDIYGNDFDIPDSTETAIRELIVEEEVEHIVVLHPYAGFANATQYGHEWYLPGDIPISSEDNKTFKECVLDITDESGPKTNENLQSYLDSKPWESHNKHPFPLIRDLIAQVDPSMTVSFAPAIGEYAEFGHAVSEVVKRTVEKFNISHSSSLRVVLVHHGYDGGYMDAQECDVYNKVADETFARVAAIVEPDLAWQGNLEIVHAAGEFAEHENPFSPIDPVSPDLPFGNVMSIGEQIESGINGQYVNQLGKLVDNGENNFDYIVAVPYYFESESSDTFFEKRSAAFGNCEPHSMNPAVYVRDGNDFDGSHYDADDADDEYFTVKKMDKSGWPSVPIGSTAPVMKGSETKPTTVIITGTFLSIHGNELVRENLTLAALKAIQSGIENKDLNGICQNCLNDN